MKQLARFGGDKKTLMQAHSDISTLRKELLKKVNPDQKSKAEKDLDDDEAGMNDDEFKSKLMQEIERELKKEDKVDSKLSGFYKKIMEQQQQNNRKEAEALLEKLKKSKNLDDLELSEEDLKNPDDEDELSENEGEELKKKKKTEKATPQEEFSGRKKFLKDDANTNAISLEQPKKGGKTANANTTLKKFIENSEEVN